MSRKENMWLAFNLGKLVGRQFLNKSTTEIADLLKKNSLIDLINLKSDKYNNTENEVNPYFLAIKKLHQNDYHSFDEYKKNIEKESCVQQLNVTDKVRLISYIFTLYNWVCATEPKRVLIWDGLFKNIDDKEIRNEILNSYYEKYNLFFCGDSCEESKSAFSYALYHLWHDTPYVSAIRSVLVYGGDTEFRTAIVSALIGSKDSTIPSIIFRKLECSIETCFL